MFIELWSIAVGTAPSPWAGEGHNVAKAAAVAARVAAGDRQFKVAATRWLAGAIGGGSAAPRAVYRPTTEPVRVQVSVSEPCKTIIDSLPENARDSPGVP